MATRWDEIKKDPKGKTVPETLDAIQKQAAESTAKTTITFGTSGWRGVIGEAFTVQNVRIAVQAIVEMMKTPVYAQETGLVDFSEVQRRGILIGRDNRLMGKIFMQTAAEVLAANGIHAWGSTQEAITPDLSLTVVQKSFAGSINFTPSHNPFEYSGLKFNPADGGTADPVLTRLIESNAETLMETPRLPSFDPAAHSAYIHSIDTRPIYIDTLRERNVVDLQFIQKSYHTDRIAFLVDNVHGASVGYLEQVLDPIRFTALRNQPDVLFGGAKPEPSAENLALLFAELKKASAPLKLGVILDPDGDRVRFTDGVNDIDMNAFGAIAFHYLATERGFPGGVAKSVATSNLVNCIAEKLGRPLFETAVGFKNFRRYLKSDQAVCAFEESDGITVRHHTLEKDGVMGALLALEITLRTGKPLGDYLKRLHQEYGAFYPKRFATPITPEQKAALVNKLGGYKPGDQIGDRKIADIITLDGFKFVFADHSWLMIRPSGTEPKVRIYVEARKESDAEVLFQLGTGLIG